MERRTDRANTATPPRNIPTWNREGYRGTGLSHCYI